MMVDRNNSDSPSRTKQKEDKQMSGNSEMLEPGIQMSATTRNKKDASRTQTRRTSRSILSRRHSKQQTSAHIRKEWKLGRFPRLTPVHEHRRSCIRRLTLAAGLNLYVKTTIAITDPAAPNRGTYYIT